MRSSFLSERLRKTADKVFKDVTTIHRTDFVRAEIALLGGKFFNHKIESVALYHTFDDIVEIELCQHVLDIAGKAVQIITEIAFDILGIRQQTFEGEFAGVVELIA